MSATSVAPDAQQKPFAACLDRLANAAAHLDRVTLLESYCTALLLRRERKQLGFVLINVRQIHQSLHHVVAVAPWKEDDMLEAVDRYVCPPCRYKDRSWRGSWMTQDW
jgi:SRSO17 transposase